MAVLDRLRPSTDNPIRSMSDSAIEARVALASVVAASALGLGIMNVGSVEGSLFWMIGWLALIYASPGAIELAARRWGNSGRLTWGEAGGDG